MWSIGQNATTRDKSVFSCVFNLNTFLKSVSISKSRVTYNLDTDRVTYNLDTDKVTYDLDTTTHKIIGVVGSPLPRYACVYHPSEISSFTVVENVFTLTDRVLTQTAEFFFVCGLSEQPNIVASMATFLSTFYKYVSGMNAFVLYVGQAVFKGTFPWQWKPTNTSTHAEYFIMDLWAASLWLLIAIILYRYEIFISL